MVRPLSLLRTSQVPSYFTDMDTTLPSALETSHEDHARSRLSSRCGGAALLLGLLSDCEAAPLRQVIPILGTAHGREPQGSVAYIHLTFEERGDHHGLQIRFHDKPGKFSRMAQTSAEQAIVRTARSLGLSTDSWTVDLRIPHEG